MSDSCECGYQYQPPDLEADKTRHNQFCVLNFSKSFAKPPDDGYPPIQNAAVPSWVAAWKDVGRLHWKLGKPPDRQLVGTPCWPHYGAGYFEESGNTAYYPVPDEKTCIDDGGPAFPVPSVGTGDPRDGMTTGSMGMTLRDWFAGMALQGYLAGRNYDPRDSRIEVVSRSCYAHADAMLVARKEASV